MPEYLKPGVYIEEISFRAKSIEESARVSAVLSDPLAMARWPASQNP